MAFNFSFRTPELQKIRNRFHFQAGDYSIVQQLYFFFL